MIKERRKELRIALLNEFIGWAPIDKLLKLSNAKISDISKSGVFIESKEQLHIGEIVELYITLPKDLGIMNLKGEVTWRRWATTKKSGLPIGFGVSIKHDNPKFEKIMESYTIYLRNKQIIEVSKRIIEEFFKQRPPTDKGPVA